MKKMQKERSLRERTLLRPIRTVGAIIAAGSAMFGLSTYVVAGGVAHATSLDGTSNCVYTDTTLSTSSSSFGGAAIVVQPGDTLNINCSVLNATSAVIAEASPLASYVPSTAPITDALAESDALSAITGVPVTGNALNVDVTIPSTFTAGNTGFGVPADPNASCPPTQAEVNAGLAYCSVALASLTGGAMNSVELIYTNNPVPAAPSLSVNYNNGLAGDSLSVSGSNWWPAGLWGAPGAGGALAPTPSIVSATVGGVSTSSTGITIHPLTYPFSTTTYTATLTPPSISGTISVPSGGNNSGVAITMTGTPFITPTGTVMGTGTGTAAFAYDSNPTLGASPVTAGPGTAIQVTGTGWDPQISNAALSFALGSPAATGAATVNSSGDLSGTIVISNSTATGSNPISALQTNLTGSLTQSTPFNVTALAAGPAPKVNQIISETVTGNPSGLTLADPDSLGNPYLPGDTKQPSVPTDVLAGKTLNGYTQTATGNLGEVVAIDSRGTLVGWTITGVLEHDFSGGSAGTHYWDNQIPASDLTVSPGLAPAPNGGYPGEASAASPSAFTTSDVGSPFGDSGNPVTLASAASGGGGGSWELTGGLSLVVPAYVSAGTYTATVDLVIQ